MLPTCSNALRKVTLTPHKLFGALCGNASNYATEATFETKPYKLHKLDDSPATKVSLTKEEAATYYEQMHIIRKLETAAGGMYRQKLIRGFCHLYSGQEAVAVGFKGAMRAQDSIISAYRVHGWTYLMGVSVYGVLAELMGKVGGCARGKGGSMHLYAENFYGGNGIVGAQVPLGAGVALAQKLRKTGGVCFTLYGDGAANQGQVFEAYNIAKLWDIPCIFVCENNGYGMGTSAERSSASTEYYKRGDYIPGIWVDGMDVVACKEAARYAIDFASSGQGPIVIEAATYRYHGHSMSDPGTSYRTRDEIQEVRHTRDPITSFKEKLSASGLLSADELKEIETKTKHEVDEAAAKAKADVEPGLEELASDVYSLPLETQIRNVTPFTPIPHKRIGPAVNFK